MCVTMYSWRNSVSKQASLLSLTLSSKALRIGSAEERAISEGLERARYALILDME